MTQDLLESANTDAMEAAFNKDRHVRYFLRCLKTFLPHFYTSNDSNRILLAFFTIAGLDLLGELQNKTTTEEREGYIQWIYHCQVPSGGFRGFPGADFGLERRNLANESWDPANVPSTFFALLTLVILGDDLFRVKRTECLQWLPKMQRENGSFGEVLGPSGKIEGGGDLRFCCFAAGTRYILRGNGDDVPGEVEDINVDKLVEFIETCQTYDGGISEAPLCESHSGHTYCGIGALTFLDRLSRGDGSVALLAPGTEAFESLVRWLVSRQTPELGDEENADNNDNKEDGSDHDCELDEKRDLIGTMKNLGLDEKINQLPSTSVPLQASLEWAGFNGRCNKYADTCYSFWNGATLAMMDRLSLVDVARNRRYLLEKTQHIVGGFGKGVGEPPGRA
ncbi:hypothetical protein EYZ11_012698 [Aspergillus tanneri]|uniref:Prenyltransferase alpha-alpha toroid domain-containing protein n=1 Tax=Aspergillus tanneri TaxID=1220188 RepID=A0A4V3UMM1_9EURO|nr:hypothetical protein EYZ11_012698 [Aspergillus tanneri]